MTAELQPLVIGPMQRIEPTAIQARCATCRWAEAPQWDTGWPLFCSRDVADGCLFVATDELFVLPTFGCVMHEARP